MLMLRIVSCYYFFIYFEYIYDKFLFKQLFCFFYIPYSKLYFGRRQTICPRKK